MDRDTAPPELTAAARPEGVDTAVAAARRVIASLLRAGGGTAVPMNEVAGTLNEVADRLDENAPPVAERMDHMWAGEGVSRHDPVTGSENAIAPPLPLTGRDDGAVHGVVTLGLPYQGPPGCVHGGVGALLLDHALGVANGWAGTPGMTAELTVRYHRTTPLFEPLTVLGRQVSVDGRKIRATGSISAGGRTRVSAEALFITEPFLFSVRE